VDIKLNNYKTSAQAVTKVCYNEPTRNLDFRIQCKDLKDLKKCVRIIKGYNDFDWKTVNKALDNWADFKQYYNSTNPNNGSDLLTYDIGRQGSPVVYVKYSRLSILGKKYQENSQIKEFTQELFEKNMRALADIAKADECDFGNDGCYEYCRLWWD